MQFTIPLSLERTKHLLLQLESDTPIFPHTVVEFDRLVDRWDSAPPVDIPRTSFLAPPPPPATSAAYEVKREWHGKYGIRYSTMGLTGKLSGTSSDQTSVTVGLKLNWTLFIIIPATILTFILAATRPPKDQIWFFLFGAFLMFTLLLDAWVLFGVYRSLRRGWK